jgi:N utilization substance protein B
MLALMALYETDLTDHPSEQVIARIVADPASLTGDPDPETAVTEDGGQAARGDGAAGVPPAAEADLAEMRRRVARLVGGVQTRIGEIDPIIAAAAPAFPIEQLAGIDRSVLRLAIYELLHEPDVPVRAVINEAVELAKRFGGDNSGRFVNGVLGTVSRRIDAEARRAKTQPTP